MQGRDDVVRAFVAGFLAARGGREGQVMFGSDLHLEPESLGERVKELFLAGSHVVLPADLYGGTYRLVDKVLAPWGLAYDLVDQADPLALEAALRERTRLIWVERRRAIREAAFGFRAEMFSRSLATAFRQALQDSVPQGTRVDDLQETEDVHPEAHGVELYAPVHDYIYRASGRVAGSFPGVVEIQRRLAEMEFVQVERLHLEGNQPEIIR